MNRHSRTFVTLVAVAFAGGCAAPRTANQSPPAVPTFAKNVAPVVYANCAGCHRPGGIGPMSLLSYEDAKANASEIREKVSSGAMPPWHSDDPRGVFANDRRLSDADRDAIVRWVDAGAPSGDLKRVP